LAVSLNIAWQTPISPLANIRYLQTPEDAFWSRIPDGCKLNQFFLRMERDLNATG